MRDKWRRIAVVLCAAVVVSCAGDNSAETASVVLPNDHPLAEVAVDVPEGSPTICSDLASDRNMVKLGSALVVRFDDRPDAVEVIEGAADFLGQVAEEQRDDLGISAADASEALRAYLVDGAGEREAKAVADALGHFGATAQVSCDFG